MNARQQLLEIFEAAVAAVQPGNALLRHVKRSSNKLTADGKEYDLGRGRLYVIGAGKGAAPMAQAVEELLGDKITQGFVAVKYGHGLELGKIETAEASHPVPDAAGERAAARILEIAAKAGPGDLLLCLLTGGASALLPAPAPGLSLDDLQKATSLLLASGATINEVNAMRKHLSRISGGRLAAAANGGQVLSIIISDVIGNSLDAIASGPTAPDPTSYADCLALAERFGIAAKLPKAALARLEKGAAGGLPETPKPGDPIFKRVQNIIAASNGMALDAAATKAAALGLEPRVIHAPIQGEARDTARELAGAAIDIANGMAPGAKPICLLAGGETTVTIRGNGLGGRNQEMALQAALLLEGKPRIAALFAGTDGTDGPTDAAGGFALADTAAKITGDPEALLRENNSHAALKSAGDLLITGPTRTNVMDVAILIIQPPLAE